MLSQLLAKGQSKQSVLAIVSYIGNDPDRFTDLVTIALSGEERSTILATWSMSYCVEAFPTLLDRHYNTLLKAASNRNSSHAVKRSVVRALQFATIPKRYQGKVMALCVGFMENKKESIATRVFSMTVLANLTQENPAFKEELLLLMEDGMPFASPAYLSRSKKILKQLHKLPQTPKD
jgi:hypothetical protein